MILPKQKLFQNIKIKLNSTTWMTLKSSLVNFQALEPLQSQWPQRPLQPHWPHQPLHPYFIKKSLNLMVGSFLAPKWPVLVPFCEMDLQNSNDPLISQILAVRGCWGQPLLIFCKYQNVITSGIYRTHYIHEILNPDTCPGLYFKFPGKLQR